MSVLIQLSEATQRLSLSQGPPQNFAIIVKQVLSAQQFQLKSFDQFVQKTNILAIIGKSENTFIRDMQWKFQLLSERLNLSIIFFDFQRQNFLRAQTQRLKYQLSILLRLINERLSSEQQFIVQPSTGLLQYHFKMGWEDYKVKIPKIQSLRRFFLYLLAKMKQFQEIIYFCQTPILRNTNQMDQRIHMFDQPLKITNNYRAIIKNTKNLRQNNIQCIGRLLELKQVQASTQQESEALSAQIQRVQTLFQNNVNLIYRNSIGLQKNEENELIHKKCLSTVSYHLNSKNTNNSVPGQSKITLDPEGKIVYGIDVVKMQRQKLLSKQGAHSEITRGMFLFRLVKSIDCNVVKQQQEKWLMGTQRQTQLTIKRCINTSSEASKNSFMNELYFLNYVRDFHSAFIGKYYLQMKNFRQRNQKDPIYMKSYYQNIDYIIRKRQTLNIKDRLALAYRISLGLCFLASKNILHRDFKPHNIVVNTSLTPHIIDFGSCCSVYNSGGGFTPFDKRLLTTKLIHIQYHQLPPQFHYIYEKMSRQQYQQHPLFDVYSFGKMMCFIMFGRFQLPQFEILGQQWSAYSELLKNLVFLIQVCLSIDPDDRPGLGEITGFLGSLSKYYSSYQEVFIDKLNKFQNTQQKRYYSLQKP